MKIQSTAITTALAAAGIRACCIGRFAMASGTWGMTDAQESFTWNGQDYAGYGEAFGFSLPPEGTQKRAEAASVTLSATDRTMLASLFAEDYVGRTCELAVLLFDPATDAVIDEILLRKGPMDAASIRYGAQDRTDPTKLATSTLSLTVASQGDNLSRPGVRTRSDADQRTHRDALDGFFKNVGIGVKAEMYWGRAAPQTVAAASGTGGRGVIPTQGRPVPLPNAQ